MKQNIENKKKKSFYRTIFIVGFMGLGVFSLSAQQFSITYSHIPASRPAVVIKANAAVRTAVPGAVWIDGYWNWNPTYNRYVRIEGYWAKMPNPKAIWIPAAWVKVKNGYAWRNGYWGKSHAHPPKASYHKPYGNKNHRFDKGKYYSKGKSDHKAFKPKDSRNRKKR